VLLPAETMDTENSSPAVLSLLFLGRVRPHDTLVDIGCGRGDVIAWWLDHYPGHQIFGIELEGTLAERTRRRFAGFANVTVLTGNACQLLPPFGTLFYLFNPFGAETMRRFIAALSKDIPQKFLAPRLIYYNFVQLNLFAEYNEFKIQILNDRYCQRSAVIDWVEQRFKGNDG
jgi:Methyltransferase domain